MWIREDISRTQIFIIKWTMSGDHRITESLKLEKTSEIIKSNRQPISATKPCP